MIMIMIRFWCPACSHAPVNSFQRSIHVINNVAYPQITVVVDVYVTSDPFMGHGHMAKGKLSQAKGQNEDALKQYKLAYKAYR